jgi:hypothetical protein
VEIKEMRDLLRACCLAQVLVLALGASAANAATNRAPTISGTPATTVAAGTKYYFRPHAWDRNRDHLTFTISGKPAWAWFSGSTGSLSGTPTTSQVGTYSNIVISVTDGQATTSLPAFSIKVTGTASTTNRAPVISGTPGTSVKAGSVYGFQPSASDADGDALTYSISGKPAWASFSTTNGQLSGTPAALQVGTYPGIVISVTDGKATASLPAFTITVTAATSTNHAPTISGTPATSVQAGTAYNFRPTVSDADGDALGFSIANKPAWATFSIVNAQLSGTPTSAQVGAYSGIVISTSDGKATTSLPAFTITVTAPTGTTNGTVTLRWSSPTTNTDGSALTNLAGYKLYHGTSASALTDVRSISSPGITIYVFDQLATGTHYFAISAVNSAALESAKSLVGSQTIP